MTQGPRRLLTPIQEIAELADRVARLEHQVRRPLLVDEGLLNGTDAVSLTAQQTHEPVLTKVISGLDANKTYKLRTSMTVAIRSAIDGATDHRYQISTRRDGTSIHQTVLHQVASGWDWSSASGHGLATFTGETSITIEVTVYSYAPDPGTGRYYYRHLVWQLYEV